MTTLPNSQFKEALEGWRTKARRLEDENAALSERVAVLEGIAQAHADDRDAYAERCAELEAERDQARGMAVDLEAQLAAAEDALAVEARAARDHAEKLRASTTREASKRVAYGQAIGSERSLAEFLTTVAWDDDPDYPDPTDRARAYAEGRNPWETP